MSVISIDAKPSAVFKLGFGEIELVVVNGKKYVIGLDVNSIAQLYRVEMLPKHLKTHVKLVEPVARPKPVTRVK